MEENRLPNQSEHQNDETEESNRTQKIEKAFKKIMDEYKEVFKRLEEDD